MSRFNLYVAAIEGLDVKSKKNLVLCFRIIAVRPMMFAPLVAVPTEGRTSAWTRQRDVTAEKNQVSSR